jgi:hypothetical protein
VTVSICRANSGPEKPIAYLRNGFNVTRIFCVVAESFSQLANRNPQTAIEINERVFRPDAFLQVNPGYHLSGIFQQSDQEAKRLLLQFDALARPKEFAGDAMHLKRAESIVRASDRCHG